ncbi:MAG: hypothetical protein NZ960_05510 [Candidatus Kapabacteria bacterium]|nr:hypothetical protein [Candidatus Kapabacteria bacterium]MDW8012671.1 hypothetical protein [Bacteroidota bacterium]
MERLLSRQFLLRAFALAVLLLGCTESPVEPSGESRLHFPGFCYTAFWHNAFQEGQRRGALLELQQQTASRWVALCVFEYQSTLTSADIAPNVDGRNPITGAPAPMTSTPDDIRAAIAGARALGMRVMLKPHVDVYTGEWRGLIQPSPAWFRAYTAMLLRYARLAEETGVEMLCIGTELVTATQPQFTPFWRRLIDTLRKVYSGRLLYAANWEGTPELPGPEYFRVGFWDELDYIGINFYPPLTQSPDEPPPPLEQAVEQWQLHRQRLARLAAQTGKRVILTEVGCQSVKGGLAAPWDYQRGARPDAVPDYAAQELYYRAVAALFSTAPWCVGVFWWAWDSIPSRYEATDYTPRAKPAAAVVREWYQRSAVP